MRSSSNIPRLLLVLLALLIHVSPLVIESVRGLALAAERAPSPEPEHPLQFMLNMLGVGGLTRKTMITPQKEFLLLGAGLGRTGTNSQKRALEMLGYKVLHSEDLTSERMTDSYTRALRTEEGFDEFCAEALRRGYNATLDSTFAILLPQFMKKYPRAKILYGTRDLDSWIKSFDNVWQKIGWPMMNPPFPLLMDFAWVFEMFERYGHGFELIREPCTTPPLSWYGALLPGKYCCSLGYSIPPREFYLRHEAAVKRLARDSGREKDLLAFDVKQGWEPLLDFLEKPRNHPFRGQPFPRENDANAIEIISKVTIGIVILFPWFVLMMVFGGYRLVSRLGTWRK